MPEITRTQDVGSSGIPPDHEHHPTTKTLDYLGLGLLLAPPAVVLEMYLKSDPINWLRLIVASLACFFFGGITVWLSRNWRSLGTTVRHAASYMIATENTFWGKAVIVIVFMTLPIVITPVFYDQESGSVAASSKIMLKSDADARAKTLIDWLKKAQKERDTAIADRDHAAARLNSTRPESAIDVLQTQLNEANAQLKTDNETIDGLRKELTDQQSGAGSQVSVLVAIALLSYDGHSITISDKNNSIQDIEVKTIIAGLSGVYAVDFTFNHNLGPFDVQAEQIACGNGLILNNGVSPINYSIGDSSLNFVDVKLDLTGAYTGTNTANILGTNTMNILIKFFRKGKS